MTYHKQIFMRSEHTLDRVFKRKRKNEKIKIYLLCLYHLVLFYGGKKKTEMMRLVCLLTVSDGSIGAGTDELQPQQQSYCSPYPPGCSAGEDRRTKMNEIYWVRWHQTISVWGFVGFFLNIEYIFGISPPSVFISAVSCAISTALLLPPLCRHPHPPLLSGRSTFLPPSSSLHRLPPSIIFIAQSSHSVNLVNETQRQTVFKKYPLFTVYPLQIILKNTKSYILCDSDSI